MGDQGGFDLEDKKEEEVKEKLRIVEEVTFWLEKLELKDRKRTQHAWKPSSISASKCSYACLWFYLGLK